MVFNRWFTTSTVYFMTVHGWIGNLAQSVVLGAGDCCTTGVGSVIFSNHKYSGSRKRPGRVFGHCIGNRKPIPEFGACGEFQRILLAIKFGQNFVVLGNDRRDDKSRTRFCPSVKRQASSGGRNWGMYGRRRFEMLILNPWPIRI